VRGLDMHMRKCMCMCMHNIQHDMYMYNMYMYMYMYMSCRVGCEYVSQHPLLASSSDADDRAAVEAREVAPGYLSIGGALQI